MSAGVDLCLLCVLLVVCPPAGIAWLFFSWHRARTDPDRRLAGTGGPALLGGRWPAGGPGGDYPPAGGPAGRGPAPAGGWGGRLPPRAGGAAGWRSPAPG